MVCSFRILHLPGDGAIYIRICPSENITNSRAWLTFIDIFQATAGDLRIMMPCTKDAASQTISDIDKPGGPVVSGPNSAANPGSISDTPHALGSAAEKEVELEASEKPDPCFLVVILSGFNVTSQSDDAVSLTASNLTSPNNINSSFRSPGKSIHSSLLCVFV